MFTKKGGFPFIPVIIVCIFLVGLFVTVLMQASPKVMTPFVNTVSSQTQMQTATQVQLQPQAVAQTQAQTQMPLAPNEFRVEDIHVGDKVAGMRLYSVGPFKKPTQNPAPNEANIPFGDENFGAVFKGNKTLTGTYNYYGDDQPFVYDAVCFTPDEESSKNLPQLQGDTQSDFCFFNQDFAQKYFGPKGSSGKATIIIDEYDMFDYPIEGGYSANFVRLVKKS